MHNLHRKTLSGLLITAAALLALSCGDRSATGPRNLAPGGATKDISDGAHNGNIDVWFLPPMVSNPSGKPGYGDPFAANLPVEIVVRDWTSSGHPVIKDFPPNTVTMSLVDQFYTVNWDTKATTLDPTHTYRIEVVIGTHPPLAFADVDLVANGSELKNATTGEYIGLVDGRTLPVKVRIEQGWNCVNDASCVSQVVPATIPANTPVTVKTNDGKDWITFHGDANGSWNNLNQPVIVTVEDVSSQLGGTPAGCAQNFTRMVVDGHCMKITTDPVITLTTSAIVCMTLTSYQLDWKMLKFDANEPAHFLGDPPLGQCPTSGPTIGSTNPSRNPIVRLAASLGNAVRRFVMPNIAYAFDAGVGGLMLAGDGFSFFAPGRPMQMNKTAGDGQTALVGTTLPVAPAVQIVTTHHGSNPVGGAIVTCTVTGGGGSLSLPSGQATEGPTGTYTCPNWTIGTSTAANANTLTVTANILDPSASGGSVVFSATGVTCATICITSLTPSSSNIILESGNPITTYTVVMHNSTGATQTGVFIQGLLDQPGEVERAAGGRLVTCVATVGNLPAGDCTMSNVPISASNLNGGSGTLVPGAATFLVELGQGTSVVDTKSIPVTLLAPQNVTSVTVTPQVGVVDVGNTLALTATVTAGGGISTAVNWISSNTAVATVNGSGVVTGVSPGSVTITARSVANFTKSATVPITVQAAGTGAFIGSIGLSNASFPNGVNPAGEWTATLFNNTGSPISGVFLQGTIVQGTNEFGAGGTDVLCPTNGLLPTGICVMTFSYATRNIDGPGPFVPGPATLKLVLQTETTVLDTKLVPVTITP